MATRLIVSDNRDDPGNPLVLDGDVLDAAASLPPILSLMEGQATPPTSARQRVWVTTAEACAALGMGRETLCKLPSRAGAGNICTSDA